jgi:hypothetical protein
MLIRLHATPRGGIVRGEGEGEGEGYGTQAQASTKASKISEK